MFYKRNYTKLSGSITYISILDIIPSRCTVIHLQFRCTSERVNLDNVRAAWMNCSTNTHTRMYFIASAISSIHALDNAMQ
jgi:hypothetical protein